MLSELCTSLVRSVSSTTLLRKSSCCGVTLPKSRQACTQKKTPTRQEHLCAMKREEYDVLVIGGGSVGCGCALDAASRGLKTALIDADDFASGASSKSSKLIDGSGSYINDAMRDKNFEQLHIMKQVLSERATMLKIAPHLNRVQPMLMPIYSVLRLPFYWLGFKAYDWLAGASNVRSSHFLSKEETLDEFPLLRAKGLRGGIVYYDGQVDDARMCLALVLSAVNLGANVANHMELVELIRKDGCCRCAGVRDVLTDEKFYIEAKAVINATGAQTDTIRQLDDSQTMPISVPTLGTTVALPSYFGSLQYGLLSPAASKHDPTLVMVPFENHVLLGTSDGIVDDIKESPMPQEYDVELLLDTARDHMDECVQLGPGHVLSAWTGMRPAVVCPTEARPLVRNYLLEVSECRLITLGGGRWSTYRVMAEEAVDTAIEVCDLNRELPPSSTKDLLLDGAEDWCSMLPLNFCQAYNVPMDVAQHISDSYGSNGRTLLSEATRESKRRLHCHFPYIEAEVHYAAKHEYACTLVDIISRRLRVAFVDALAALQMLPRILAIMSEHHKWEKKEQRKQLVRAQHFLVRQMGLGSVVRSKQKTNTNTKTRDSASTDCDGQQPKLESTVLCKGLAPKMVFYQGPKPNKSEKYQFAVNFNYKCKSLAKKQSTATIKVPISEPSFGFLPLPVTSGITTGAANSRAKPKAGLLPMTWTMGKRDLASSVWRNKFMC
ncbi:glycerol-3-phosphate dehydrogenase, mitochondrial [Drosophila guanche]|uniref:Glycerol-3-phosphate dehydrogenase n=1 Tax=Drosophila guanche TaxID=7266 RepID=A0A3B0KFC2_DROGU|nr:glycerol-3-phosphate dehydrogenase, mitochondrial [Drosophila guanche]SPP82318.1 blast:Glycerol-3-phosphate dehydrogenase%2C mitochondrial [Drosophila guanche]